MFENLVKKYPQLLKVKQRTVQYYVSKKKLELTALDQQARLLLYHPTGEAQVDFGHVSVYDDVGMLIDVLKLTMSFPYSNKSYCQVFGGENQQCLLQGIKNIYVTGDCAAFLSLKIDMQDTEKFKQEVKTHLIYRGWKNIENKKDRIVYSRNKQKVALVAEDNDTWCVVITDVENKVTKILYPRVNF